MKLSIFNTPRPPKTPPEPSERANDLSGPSSSITQPASSVPPQDDDNQLLLKRRALNRLFVIAILLGVLVFAVNLSAIVQQSQWVAFGLFSLVLLALIAAALFRRLSFTLRVFAVLSALFIFGLISLTAQGLYGGGLILLIIIPYLAAILTGRRGRITCLLLTIAAVVLVGTLMVTGRFPAPVLPPASSTNNWLAWLAVIACFGLLAIGGVTSFGIVLDGLRESLGQQQHRSVELEDECTLLETRLEESNDDLRRRLLQIRTAAEINRAISRMLNIDQLLPQVCELVRQRFDLYYVGVFLIERSSSAQEDAIQGEVRDFPDAERLPSLFSSDAYPPVQSQLEAGTAWAVLKAGSGEAGQRMLAEGHRLAVGSDSMIGWATANRQPRIAQNVGQEVVRFNNPHLPLTRSELALPIQIYDPLTKDHSPMESRYAEHDGRGGRVLGAMTIQSSQEAAFDQDDILILQSIADSLASAIENARLFAATQSSLDEISTLHRQYLEQAWQLEAALRGEIAYSHENDTLLPKTIHTEERLEVPIRLRDQVIGSLTLEPGISASAADSDRTVWSAEELALVEAVADQAALALENARLLDETRRKVNLERTATNITSKLWATTDFETILRTALQELSLSLGAQDGRIELLPSAFTDHTSGNGNSGSHTGFDTQTIQSDEQVEILPQKLDGVNPAEARDASD